MRELSSRPSRNLWLSLLSVIGGLASTGALAATVTSYIVVQPIDVCSGTGANCAPINGSLQTSATNPGTTQIGFIDPATGVDVTRAMLNQVGIDVTWNPVAQYNSAINPNTGTTYQTLNIVGSTTNSCSFSGTGTGLTSCDFLTLSQQPSISTGIVPRTTTPKGVPVSSNPTTINMFFVNTINPPPTQTGFLYGFSWINNNGIAIGVNTFEPPLGLAPRFDTIAHEILHNLALTHTDYFAASASDLETAGASRTQASTSGCSSGGALFDLLTGTVSCSTTTADLLTFPAPGTPENCPSLSSTCTQQGATHLSNFLNPVQTVTTSGSKKSSGGTTSTKTGPSPFDSISGSCNSDVIFTVTYPGDSSGRPNEYLADIDFTLPADLSFVRGTYKPLDQTARRSVATVGLTNNGDLLLVLNKGAFPPAPASSPAFFQFTVGVVFSGTTSCASLATGDLGGTQVQYVFSDGYSPTTTLTCGSVSCDGGSQSVDLTTPAVLQNPDTFVGANTLPCTPSVTEIGDTVVLTCPNPKTTGVADGNPSEEVQPD